MLNSLPALLSLHEGRQAKKYKDSLGFWTIGVGHLIDPRKGGSIPKAIQIELDALDIDIWADEPMPESVIDKLLQIDILEHQTLLRKFQPWVALLDPVRQAVLDDMVFNLGPEPFDEDGFKDWPNFLRQVRTGDYAGAARNMLSTTWAKQVKSRATRLAQMMESGKWPEK